VQKKEFVVSRGAIAVALVLGFLLVVLSWVVVFAEDGCVDYAPSFCFSTVAFSWQAFDGSTTYAAGNTATTTGGSNLTKFNLRGANSDTGWHWADQSFGECLLNCRSGPVQIGSSKDPAGTQSYAVALDEWWQNATQQGGAWSSSDGAHSSFDCWSWAGCSP